MRPLLGLTFSILSIAPTLSFVSNGNCEGNTPLSGDELAIEQATSELEKYRKYPKAAKDEAIRLYPELGVAGTPLHTEFIARGKRYEEIKKSYFAEPDWPIRLAKESFEALHHSQAQKETKDAGQYAPPVRNEALRAFASFYFGETKDEINEKLKTSDKVTKENDSYYFFIGEYRYLVFFQFEEDKLFQVIFKACTFGQDIENYDTRIKQYWSALREVAVSRFGDPTESWGYPSLLSLERGYTIFSDSWVGDKVSATLGIVDFGILAGSVDAYTQVHPILRIEDKTVADAIRLARADEERKALNEAKQGF